MLPTAEILVENRDETNARAETGHRANGNKNMKHITQSTKINWAVRALPLLLVGMLLAGCSTAPKQHFVSTSQAEPDKALIYIYRPKNFVGSANKWRIFANQEHVFSCRNGSYYPFHAGPGKIAFSCQVHLNALNTGLIHLIAGNPVAPLLTNDFSAGNTYYVRFSGANLKMALVDESQGAAELQKCTLYQEASPEDSTTNK